MIFVQSGVGSWEPKYCYQFCIVAGTTATIKTGQHFTGYKSYVDIGQFQTFRLEIIMA